MINRPVCQAQRLVVLTMIYNLWGIQMTVMERAKVSVAPAQRRRGSEGFQQLELPQK
jgi:hypothetical protein